MGDSISEGVIESFVAPVGKLVKADDVIARIETDKVTVDILAKFDGVITKYYAAEGDTVAVGANFCDIDPSGTPSSGSASPPAPKNEAPKVFLLL
jgi:2-oxoglutarate dehydrogenase E2 component (dihydrolipoamide succinyltransferase)